MKILAFILSLTFYALPFVAEASVCSEQTQGISDKAFIEAMDNYCDNVAKFCKYFSSSPECMGDENPENINKYKVEWAARHDQWLTSIAQKRSTVVKNIFPFSSEAAPTKAQVEAYESKLKVLDLLSRDLDLYTRGAINTLASDLQREWMNTFSEVFSSWALFQENINMWGPLTGFAATNYALNSAAMHPKGVSSVFAFMRHKMPARLAIFSVPFLAGTVTNKIGETPFEVPLSPAHIIHFDYSMANNFKGEENDHLFGMKDFASDPEVLKVLEDLENERDLIAYSAGTSATLASASTESRKALYGKKIVNVLRVVKGVTPMSLVVGLAIEAAVRGGVFVYDRWKIKDDLVENLEALYNYSKNSKMFKQYHESKGRNDLSLRVDEKLAEKRSAVLHQINVIDKFYSLEDQSTYWAVAAAFNSLTSLVVDEESLELSALEWFKQDDDVLNASGLNYLKDNYCYYLVNGYYNQAHSLGTIGTYALSIKHRTGAYVSSLKSVLAVLDDVSSSQKKIVDGDALVATMFKARKARIESKIKLAQELVKKAESFELHQMFQTHFESVKKDHLRLSYENENEKRLVPKLINGFSCKLNNYINPAARPLSSPCTGCHGGSKAASQAMPKGFDGRWDDLNSLSFPGRDLDLSEGFLKALEQSN